MPRTLLGPRVTRLTVLYDGDCGFCRWSVDVLRDLDRGRRLELVPLQHSAAHPRRPELRDIADRYPLEKTIHVLSPDGAIRAGGGAVLEILDALPGGWLLRPWALLPGVEAVVDVAYAAVARRRGTISRLLARHAIGPPPCDLDAPRGAT